MDGRPDIHSDDFYEVLGVAKSATPEEIKRAYLALVREHTPERSPEAFKRIRAAYETLSDLAARERYDARPNARIRALLEEATRAMNARDLRRAEQLYGEVLREEPQLLWVRNQLGVCLLIQERPKDAIAQYELILEQPCADPVVHNNLAHAYAMVLRCDEADREYRIAMSLAGEQAYRYGVALIDMIVDFRHDPAAAEEVAQELLRTAPHGSVAAAAYYTKLVELALHLKRPPTIRAIVLRMIQGLETHEAKRITSAALGNMGAHLITHKLFELAEFVAQTARQLVPEDPGFDALEQIGRLLRLNDYAGARRLLHSHVSFAPGGPVHWLVTWVEKYIEQRTAPPAPAARRSAAARSGVGPLRWFLPFMLVGVLTQLVNSNSGGSSSVFSTQPDPQANETRYEGILTSTPQGGSPIQAQVRLDFADLRNGNNGYCTVSPPLPSGGFCSLQTSRDSVWLAIYAGTDIIQLRGVRGADTIGGTYSIRNGTAIMGTGEWRAWFVSGPPIPP